MRMTKRLLIGAALLALVIGGLWVWQRSWGGLRPLSAPSADERASLLQWLESDTTADAPAPDRGAYQREFFGEAWQDVDHNSCDTRNDILGRDVSDADYSRLPGVQGRLLGFDQGVFACPNATVFAGTLADPYSGQSVDFVRGAQTSEAVQIDHIVPLFYFYAHGGWRLVGSPEQDRLVEFANDPLNLLAVSGAANQDKLAKGPSEWVPANEAYRCEYASRWVAVYEKYQPLGLTLDPRDREYLLGELAACN